MKQPAFPILSLLLLAALTVPAAAQETAVSPVTFDEFTVSLPAGFGEFSVQEQTIQGQSGPIKNVTSVSKSPEGDAIIVSYSEFTGRILNPNQMMSEGLQSLLKSVGATAESETRRELDAHPGLYALFGSEKLFGRTHFGVDDDRMYQIIYLSADADRRHTPAADAFFKSFRFEDTPARPGADAATGTPHSATTPDTLSAAAQ